MATDLHGIISSRRWEISAGGEQQRNGQRPPPAGSSGHPTWGSYRRCRQAGHTSLPAQTRRIPQTVLQVNVCKISLTSDVCIKVTKNINDFRRKVLMSCELVHWIKLRAKINLYLPSLLPWLKPSLDFQAYGLLHACHKLHQKRLFTIIAWNLDWVTSTPMQIYINIIYKFNINVIYKF